MAKITSISLGEHFSDFVDERIKSGRYRSASEVVQEGLRLPEEHESKINTLRNAPIEGELSGSPTPFDFDSFIADKTSS